jgi:hypothetical protein
MVESPESRELERGKLEIERQRLELEKKAARRESRRSWTVPLTVLIPLVTLAITVMVQLASERTQAQRDFELKAAELVLSEKKPSSTYNKARALKALFPERLPDGFAKNFDPANYAGTASVEQATIASKKELITLIADHPDQRRLVVRLWRGVFPEDEWLPGIEAVTGR